MAITHWYSPLGLSKRLHDDLREIGLRCWLEALEDPPPATVAIYPLPHEVVGLPLAAEAILKIASNKHKYKSVVALWRLEGAKQDELWMWVNSKLTAISPEDFSFPLPNAVQAVVTLQWLQLKEDVAQAFAELETHSCHAEHDIEAAYCESLRSVISAQTLDADWLTYLALSGEPVQGLIEEEEAKVMLLQLHQAQEWMERYYSSCSMLEAKLERANDKLIWLRTQRQVLLQLQQRYKDLLSKLVYVTSRVGST